ncbi:hypothetical protein HP15_970 [Marinobacter adhaerens HP15]|uniref:Uncharacterized protein n=1 Tax=Marinobacter adhaerens (strain DSM 23420 / HP15) TaxID=225937 RepID=E4PFI5_MARAH|nr:hypothetical protein HP15_970 [Marinobacter adhaerens HP15]
MEGHRPGTTFMALLHANAILSSQTVNLVLVLVQEGAY